MRVFSLVFRDVASDGCIPGYTNTSLYTGDIDYIDIPGTPSYWYLDISCESFV